MALMKRRDLKKGTIVTSPNKWFTLGTTIYIYKNPNSTNTTYSIKWNSDIITNHTFEQLLDFNVELAPPAMQVLYGQ